MLQNWLPLNVYVPVENLDLQHANEFWVLSLDLLVISFSQCETFQVSNCLVEELGSLLEHDRVVPYHCLGTDFQS